MAVEIVQIVEGRRYNTLVSAAHPLGGGGGVRGLQPPQHFVKFETMS